MIKNPLVKSAELSKEGENQTQYKLLIKTKLYEDHIIQKATGLLLPVTPIP